MKTKKERDADKKGRFEAQAADGVFSAPTAPFPTDAVKRANAIWDEMTEQ